MASSRRRGGLPTWACWALVAAWVAFIWSRSLFSGPESGAQSAAVVAVVRPAFEAAGVSDLNLMTLVVRKTAHFSEYFVLGVLLALTRPRGSAAWQQLFFGVSVPVADEFIQAFVPGRGSLVTDVVIDSAGMACGLSLATFILSRLRSRH